MDCSKLKMTRRRSMLSTVRTSRITFEVAAHQSHVVHLRDGPELVAEFAPCVLFQLQGHVGGGAEPGLDRATSALNLDSTPSLVSLPIRV
jgi:hypothetical protein